MAKQPKDPVRKVARRTFTERATERPPEPADTPKKEEQADADSA